MTDYTTLTIQRETKPYFEQAKQAVEAELGENATHDDVVRELVEAYTGRNALGEWQQ